MASSTTPFVDHIIILIPHSFLTAPPSWFADLFHFYPGGRHADGLTENTLVLLADGSYIEFIAFVPGIDPAQRAAHHWGSKKEGTVVDWALTLLSPEEQGDGERSEGGGLSQEKAFREIQKRVRDANAGIVYADPVRGGRTRPDGTVLKWAVAFAERAQGSDQDPLERGTVPFWCFDVTPRHLRVPYEEPRVAKHPTGAVGVAKVEVLPELGQIVKSASAVYDALFEPKEATDVGSSWKVETISGGELHSEATASLGTSDGPFKINISLFTDDPKLAGTSVGGKVDEDHTLTFHLVAASGKKA